MEIARARPHGQIARRHRFEIVVEDVGLRRDDRLDRAVLAQEIGREHLDRRGRAARADRADGCAKCCAPPSAKIVAVDRGDDDVGKPELSPSPPRRARARAGRARPGNPGLDVAEGAGARAGVAHDHEGGVLLLPALADIGAAGLLAHGVQAVLAHDPAGLGKAARERRLDADPRRLAQHGRIRPVRLLGMARAGYGVEDDGHECSGATRLIPNYEAQPHTASQRCAARLSGFGHPCPHFPSSERGMERREAPGAVLGTLWRAETSARGGLMGLRPRGAGAGASRRSTTCGPSGKRLPLRAALAAAGRSRPTAEPFEDFSPKTATKSSGLAPRMSMPSWPCQNGRERQPHFSAKNCRNAYAPEAEGA